MARTRGVAPGGACMTPAPAAVRYNDWREIAVAPHEAFTPTLPVSVIVPSYEAPRALTLTLAALEGQAYPRDLFEVVVVDDGSRTPLKPPRSSPLDVRVVRQEDRGFGLARARNTGVRAAAHGILLFLDGDMLPEAGWLAAHARWHHAASDLLTLGFYARVAVEGASPEMIRRRPESLRELLAGRPADHPRWIERYMARTRALTSRADNPFSVVSGGNFGIGRALFERAGGFDESFTRWGLEDTELGYRAYTAGGVLVPVREAFAWHQGRRAEDRERKDVSHRRQRAKAAHLIAHHEFRDARPGRIFSVPQYVVTVASAAELPADSILATVEAILADRVHDLVVRVELPEEDARRGWLADQLGPDPRVRIAPPGTALDDFPAASFHVAIPGGAVFAPGLVHRLRGELGPSVAATALLSDGTYVSIVRAWALHRARRTGRDAADFGDTLAISARRLRIDGAPGARRQAVRRRLRRLRIRVSQVRMKTGRLRTLRQAWWFLEWLAGVVRGRMPRRFGDRGGESVRTAPVRPGARDGQADAGADRTMDRRRALDVERAPPGGS